MTDIRPNFREAVTRLFLDYVNARMDALSGGPLHPTAEYDALYEEVVPLAHLLDLDDRRVDLLLLDVEQAGTLGRE